ncbi:MAG: hypothetical protein KAW41_00310 [Candidatus Diapherotrites archaeon]|nr:hypothetical protein [Candidatus Diapherotrites archaeon]
MKQVLALALVACLLVTVGCVGGKKAEVTPTPTPAPEVTATPTPESVDDAPALADEVIPEVNMEDDAEDVDFGGVI